MITIESLKDGELGKKVRENKFDALVMTEVIEHLAFNPLKMWKEIMRILRPKAKIFISTPNSMRLENIVREIARILTMRGMGESVKGIMETVTYGHHWKEYSPREIYDYFNYIGIEDEFIEIEFYSYRGDYENSGIIRKLGNKIKNIGNKFDYFSEEMFITVEVPSEKPSVPSPPSYG